MSKLDRIVDAIKKRKYARAELSLKPLLQKAPNDPYINYLLGYLYQDHNNPARSLDKAKRHFRVSIASDKPYEDSFWNLSWLEKDQEQAKRILQRGLTFYPDNKGFHERLLAISPDNEKAKLFDEIVKRRIDSDSSRTIMIRHHFNSGNFVLALNLIDKMQTQDKTDRMVLRIFKGLCFLEKAEIDRALTEFQQLISQDIANVLEFAPHVLSIVAISRQDSPCEEEALKLFAQLPEDFQFVEPYVPGTLGLWIDYMAYLQEAMKFLLKSTRKKDIIARVRAIRALSVVGNDAYGYYAKAKAHKDLIHAHSVLPFVSKYTETLCELAEDKGDSLSAYNYSIEIFRPSFGEDTEGKADTISWAFLSDSTNEIFQHILEDFEQRLRAREFSQQVAVRYLTPIIERLHKEKNYSAVQKLVNLLGHYSIDDTEVLFEAAYALAECDDNKRATKYYELHLKRFPSDTGALNNLALIREKGGDLLQAEQLLSKAKNLNPDHVNVKRNLERVRALRKKGAEFMKMSFKNKTALLRLWETKDLEDKITINVAELPSLLGLSGDEAKNILDLFIKNNILLLCPVKVKTIKTKKYILNPEVRCHIVDIEKEVEDRTPIIEIVNDITNDGLSRIGFNQDIVDALSKVFSSELRKYLKRDLQEAAFSLLTRSYKTTQVMCGSIIEAVLLDKLSKQGKTNYPCEDKKIRNINRMNLDQLLFVALQENLIDEHLYHLAHGLRGYRNLIHPGVEQRGKAISISESNAKLSWDITRKLLKEVHLPIS